MSVSLYFGLPGCGKTSILTQMAVHEASLIKMGQSRYSCVITNVPISCEGVYYTEDFSWFGKQYVKGALYLIDEATLLWDSREYKVFVKGMVKGFVLHRHTHNDIVLFVQIWNRIDKTIRDICDKVYYVHKGAIFKKLSYSNHIPYSILFPDSGSDSYGDILMGYKKCSFFQRCFSFRLYRPFVYGYYDSFWIPEDMSPKPLSDFDRFWEHSLKEGHPMPKWEKLLARCAPKTPIGADGSSDQEENEVSVPSFEEFLELCGVGQSDNQEVH